MDDLKGFRHRTMLEIAADYLRLSILNGKFHYGEQLNQDTIAETLQMSRTPIREALKVLAAEGFVELKPHRSAVVVQHTRGTIENAMAVRSLLETEAARLGAPNLTDEDIQEQRQLVDMMNNEALEPVEWLKANQQFHMILFRRSPNKRLVKLVEAERDKMRPYIAAASFTLDRRHSSDHEKILEACERRDPDLCATLTAKHLQQTNKVLVEWLSQEDAEQEKSGSV